MWLRNGVYSFLLRRVEVGRVLRPFSTFLAADLRSFVLTFVPKCKHGWEVE